MGNYLADRRIALGYTQKEIASMVGVTEATISRWESGAIANMRRDRINLLANALKTTPDFIMTGNITSTLPSPDVTEDTITFPVLVDVAAGYDQPAQYLQNWEGEKIEVPRAFLHGRTPDDYFAMRVVGDSMYPDYQDGDVLLVLRQATYDYSGQVCVVLYDGEDATLKRVECVPGEWMKLLPINPQYPPRTISGVDLEQCRIIGLPKILVRDIK